MKACWKITNMRRRVSRARKGPHITCASSRHVQTMADCLSGPHQEYPMFEEEPEHCARSLYAVVESLWKARAQILRLNMRIEELENE